MQFVETAIEAAQAAGRVACARLGAHGQIRLKGFRDIVTEADVEAQAAAQAAIRARFPDAAILGEESAREAQAEALRAETVWIVDPIDGTTNFSRGLPLFSVSIGVKQGDDLVAGAVYDPSGEYMFYAARGAGAFLRIHQDEPQALHCGAAESVAEGIVGIDWSHATETRRQIIEYLGRLAPACRTVRALGSAALGICYVAAGWTDIYYHLGLAAWDAAGGVAIVREAGGRVTDIPSVPGTAPREWDLGHNRLLATNGRVHDEALRVLLGA